MNQVGESAANRYLSRLVLSIRKNVQTSHSLSQDLLAQLNDWMATRPPLLHANEGCLAACPFEQNNDLVSLPYQGNARLGFLYQHLCHQQFASLPHYQVIAQELPINQAGRTVGAIDFVLHNLQSQQIEHWEVAIKFYILCDGLWYGPNSQDRFDLKLSHMLNHQLTMSQHPCFKEQFPQLTEIKPKLLMQGRLYINPFHHEVTPKQCLDFNINPNRVTGQWCFAHQLASVGEPLYQLNKNQWLTGKDENSPLLTLPPTQVIHCQSQSGQFWFVLPDSWPSMEKR